MEEDGSARPYYRSATCGEYCGIMRCPCHESGIICVLRLLTSSFDCACFFFFFQRADAAFAREGYSLAEAVAAHKNDVACHVEAWSTGKDLYETMLHLRTRLDDGSKSFSTRPG
jgi:hypothetical protein